jgi:hypothetical protein
MPSPWDYLTPDQPAPVPGAAPAIPPAPDQGPPAGPSPWQNLPAEPPPKYEEPESISKRISDFGENLATGILKSAGALGSLPHTIAQLGDVGMAAAKAVPGFYSNFAAAAPGADPSSPVGPGGMDMRPMMPSVPPIEPGYITRHTVSPEDRQRAIFQDLSDISVATGGQPFGPYQPQTPIGKIVQAGAEQALPSLIGPGEGMLARMYGGMAGGAAQNAYAQLRPNDVGGQMLTGLLVSPTVSLGATGLARAGTGVGRIAAGRWGSPENQALYRTGAALDADMAAGGPNPLAIGMDMRAAPNTPLTPGDVGGENLTKLLGQTAREPGPARQLVKDTLDTRDQDAFTRLTNLADTLVPGAGTYRTGQQLKASAQAAAGPAYDAFENAAPLNPDHLLPGGDLSELLKRPAVQEGMKGALKSAANEGINPTSLGITFNEAGDPVFKGVPSWRTLDFVKTNIDDTLDPFRNDLTGRLDLNRAGRANLKAVQDFTQFVDNNNPLYAPARALWGGDQQANRALKMGAAAFRPGGPEIDQITDDLSGLSPSDQTFYRLGAKNELKTQMSKLSPGADESKTWVGTPDRQNRIRAVFGPDADTFLNAGTAEQGAFRTRYDTLGGSPTAGRFMQDVMSPGAGMADKYGPLIAGGASMMFGEPFAGLPQIARGLGNIFGGNKLTPEVSLRIAKGLLDTDPATAHQFLTNAYSRFRAPAGALLTSSLPLVPMASGLLGPYGSPNQPDARQPP